MRGWARLPSKTWHLFDLGAPSEVRSICRRVVAFVDKVEPACDGVRCWLCVKRAGYVTPPPPGAPVTPPVRRAWRRCAGVRSPRWGGGPCNAVASLERDGAFWCTDHVPEAVAARAIVGPRRYGPP